jgi:hypothetical protein
MGSHSSWLQIIHGFAEMTMETDTHPCDGLLGGFIGDRMVISVDGAQVVHEPPFVMIRADTFLHSVTVRPASDSAIKKMKATNESFLPPPEEQPPNKNYQVLCPFPKHGSHISSNRGDRMLRHMNT